MLLSRADMLFLVVSDGEVIYCWLRGVRRWCFPGPKLPCICIGFALTLAVRVQFSPLNGSSCTSGSPRMFVGRLLLFGIVSSLRICKHVKTKLFADTDHSYRHISSYYCFKPKARLQNGLILRSLSRSLSDTDLSQPEVDFGTDLLPGGRRYGTHL